MSMQHKFFLKLYRTPHEASLVVFISFYLSFFSFEEFDVLICGAHVLSFKLKDCKEPNW
jgi:hypothetical protein